MKRKFSFVLLIILLTFVMLTVMVDALSFTTTMTPNNTSVDEATEVVITVSVSNLDVGDSGINSYSAYLSYDTEVFETLTDSSVEGLNNWSSTYSATSGQILLTKNSFVNSDEDIMQITLKTKEGIEEGTEGTVSLTGIVASNSEDNIDGTTVSTTITVGTEAASEGNTTETPSNIIQIEPSTNNVEENSTDVNNANTDNTDNSSNTNTNNSSVYNINTNTNTSNDDDIPYTGVSGDGFIKIILGVIFIALVIYIKIRKMDELK